MSYQTVEAAGVALAVESTGTGKPVFFVHGIATDHRLWRETIEALGDDVRAISYDRRAYGASGSPEPYGGTTVAEQADDLIALLQSLDAVPAILCGQDLGALICMDVLVREPALVRAAVLIDPPLLWLSADGPEVMSTTMSAIERGARELGAVGAVEAYLDDVAGSDATALLGFQRTEAAVTATRAFAADLAAASTWSAGRRELRGVRAPVKLLVGSTAAPIFGEVAATLATLLADAHVEVLTAGHLAPIEAPDAVASAIRGFADR